MLINVKTFIGAVLVLVTAAVSSNIHFVDAKKKKGTISIALVNWRTDVLDVKYNVYNGKKLVGNEIFNFLEHEIEADDKGVFGIGVKFSTKGLAQWR